MRRRDFLNQCAVVAAGGALLQTGAWARVAGMSEGLPPLARAASAAYLFGLPLLESARSRSATLAAAGIAQNEFHHDRQLATADFRSVTTPNNDTLYSRVWLDLSKGPVTLSIPDMEDRYFCVPFLDIYSNHFAILGTRTTGGKGGVYTIVGPDMPGAGPDVIRSPTPQAWLIARLLVDGPDDLPAVHALQDRFRVDGPSLPPPDEVPGYDASSPELLDAIARMMADNPPRPIDGEILAMMAPLDMQAGPVAERFDAAGLAQIEQGRIAAENAIKGPRRQGAPVNRWIYPKYNIGNYGVDYLYRAQVALGGLGALPREEAMYMRAQGPEGTLDFAPGTDYVLSFARDELPPVDAFWSITMYERTADGQWFLTSNPISRYAIGDRTEGLVYNEDGSLDIHFSSRDPGEGKNWLPAPADKIWNVVFRGYLPRDAMLLGDYALPEMKML